MATGFSIADAAKTSGLSAHALRYYERAGLLDPIDRDESGHRRYRDEDLDRIRFLTKLRATGMPIREVRRYAELIKRGNATSAERMQLLESHREAVRALLTETAKNLEQIEAKIDYYRQQLEQQ
jgi:DNA-binding transcriptional MerR regulator